MLVVAIAFPVAARADEAAVLYEPADVSEIDLTLSDESRQALLSDPRTYVAATFRLTVAGSTFGPKEVQVKLKGHGAFRPLDQKAAFKVKFAKTDRLLGLKSMTLNNMVQDPSMVHETLGYELLRAAGVPASRTGYAYVRVNGQGYGLYLNLETYDDVSLSRLFATTQHLYEADDPGVDVTPGGAGAYEVDEGDEDDLSDLEALITATNATGSDWSAGMEASADLDEMTRMWAGEQYLGHWDGYSVSAGHRSPSNYYLHSDAAGRFTMLASGLDQTFGRRVAFGGDGDGLLITRCLGDTACLEAFRSNLGEVSAAADEIDLETRLDAIAAIVAGWRPLPDLERADDPAWEAAVAETRAFIRDRPATVAAYLTPAAPVSTPVTTTPTRVSADPPPPVAGRLRPRRLTTRVTPGRDERRPYRFTISGSLLLPPGLSRATACNGRVAVRIKAGARTVSLRRATLRKSCTFASTVTFRKRGFGGRRKLTVQAHFEGNGSLLPRSAATKTVGVRSGHA
jgi:CotH kinase protein